jgi:hypothetical protein
MGGLSIWSDNNFMTESDIILEPGFKQNITPKALFASLEGEGRVLEGGK